MKVVEKKITDIIPYDKNPRINDDAVDFVAKSIKEFGFRVPINVDANNVIITGHTRLKAAIQLGLKTVPVVVCSDLTEEQVKAYRLADNKVSEFALWDEALLNAELAEIEDLNMEDFGFELDFDDDETNEVTEDDYEEEPPEEPKAKFGDVYQLGEHRLMCGDSTDAEMVKCLMGGYKADMVFTDPPYNVAIGDKNKALQTFQKAGRITENLKNDVFSTDEECGEKLWFPAFSNMLKVANDNCSIYVTMPQGGTHMMMMMMMMAKAGWQVKHELIWVKNSPTFSMGRLDYDYQHEPICFGWNKGHKKIGKGKFTKSIWQIDKPKKCDVHPTMKPIELMANALENSSEENDIVLDLFGGSGSTLIACEQLNRKCFMMEYEPKYIDVIINRWEKLTGKKAEKVV